MTSVINMRDAIKGAYDSNAWRIKVNRMSDAQVIAIFKRLQEQHKV